MEVLTDTTLRVVSVSDGRMIGLIWICSCRSSTVMLRCCSTQVLLGASLEARGGHNDVGEGGRCGDVLVVEVIGSRVRDDAFHARESWIGELFLEC